ncbi:Putative HMP/thiamine import ATP-binding protein YkoD [Corynebacterium ciconiae DSM 44920]|uniref:ABC transporter ATP-binding protein n=1 Tax=Corynebacterium ciconiae TaxID=227319 RepID=UPI0003795D40|nr:ABC transporter ATP-binding protein [Corynebacterium ciconiae]WKD60845.1 Putative HMP/thiamine import ATP-binding protein YkoD [Corynebacterium ciconiae DSM 44920]
MDTSAHQHGDAAVRLRNYSWRHGGRKNPTLRSVDLDIEQGERVLVLGQSGAGKSTLLHAIAGVLGGEDEGDEHGSVSIGGRRPEQARGVVGMVLQDPDSQVISSRVGDDVAFGCENLGLDRDEIWRRVPDALEMVGLRLPLEHPTAELSGGQKQRLALAGVIAMGARVIVLDEPTANLDPAGVQDVRDAVIAVAERTGATLIVVEHRVDIWQHHLERAVVVGAEGSIVADGPLDTIIAEQGTTLAEQGVWVPGVELDLPNARSIPAGQRPALSASELVVGWQRHHPIAGPIDLDFPAGCSTVITGDNGAGKSTLALTVAGLLRPLDGEVWVHTHQGSVSPHRMRSRALARTLGYVFQDPEHQFVARTVREELLVGPRVISGDKHMREHPRVDELLERLRLSHLAEANPFTLSGGQKRRLSVATALVSAPQLVLLDEPTFGQDRRTFVELVHLIRELADDGVAVSSITHDDLFIHALGDHRIHVDKRGSVQRGEDCA